MRLGLITTLTNDTMVELVAEGYSIEEAGRLTEAFFKTSQGKAYLKSKTDAKLKDIENQPILKAVNSSSHWSRGIAVNLISGAIGAALSPLVFGLLTYLSILGGKNTLMFEQYAGSLLPKATITCPETEKECKQPEKK